MYSGGTPDTNRSDYYSGDIPWINSSELNKNKIYKTISHISKLGLNSSSAKIVAKNTFLLAMYGATAGVCAISKVSEAINQAVLAVISDKIMPEYLFEYFTLKKNNIINTYCQGGQPNLSGRIVKKIRIQLPTDLVEQKAIANILSEIDSEIESLQIKMSKMKYIKTGMMQELLTGKTRLI